VYVYVYMGTKTISIKKDAYERLKEHKRDDESFTDVVNRLTRGDKDPADYLGTMPGLADEVDSEEFREKFDEDFKERQREIFGQ
jgi:predicted CopG family antitoxin